MRQPWKTEKWFTSPWNYLPEVREQFNFPEKIRIHDVSLRDGEQQTGTMFRKDEKVAIAKKLAEAGVHRIEAGMPAVSPEDEAAIKEIVNLGLDSEIFSFARCMPADVKLAKECGVKGIITEIPSSDHIIKNAYGKDMDWAIKSSIDTTLAAKAEGLYTTFFTIDSTRSDLERYMDLIDKVSTEGHMDSMTLADSFGGTTPQAIAAVVRKFKERFHQPIEIHCHQDFDLGVANTIAALANGASVAHVTVSAIGERAGNVPLEDTVMALLCLYGIDVGIKTEVLYDLSKLVQQCAGIQLPPNRPLVGDMLYDIESGIVAMFHRRCKSVEPCEYIPFLPELIGRPPVRIALGKGCGNANVEEKLEERGKQATPEQIPEIVSRVKEKSMEQKKLLTDAEFDEIVKKVVGA
ncbi:MAG: pyruvate carboxyltransferase [Armatimonadetes bacterium CG2_30_59_28]|nr:MAG: pyruvate carboxyltransferase [Armatimonadetes bacterium CG2_30_59_28]PIU62478.1 MAG: pyruvate carboxyltransferase [Armatimonadetes bacterium CG07_land_8_20_14_0_80_59_28]